MPLPPASQRGSRSRRIAVAVLTALAVWVPYLTLALPFRTALVTQAAGLLLLFAGAVLWGGRSRPRPSRISEDLAQWWSGLQARQRGVVAGLALYALAGLLGAGMGLVQGNAPSLLTGQLLAMGLLPLGALAGLSLGPAKGWRSFQNALVAAVAAAVLLHLLHWAWLALQGEALRRLVLRHSTSVTGPALLALACAVAGSLRAATFRSRLASRVCLVLLCLFVLGSGTRGLWLVAPLVAAATLLLSGREPRPDLSASRRWVGWVALLGVVALLAFSGWRAHLWLHQPRPDLLHGLGTEILREEVGISSTQVYTGPTSRTPGDEQTSPLPRIVWKLEEPAVRDPEWKPRARHLPPQSSYRFPAVALPAEKGRGGEAPQTVRVRFEARCEDPAARGNATLRLHWLDPQGRTLERVGGRITPHLFWQDSEIIWPAPAGGAAIALELTGDKEAIGTWALRSASVEELGPARWSPLLAQVAYLDQRIGSLLDLLPGRQAQVLVSDSSLSVRLGESREILRRYREAGLARQLFGHGLGATFTLEEKIPSAARDEATGEQNYLHNFYLFLVFKLGLAGTLLVSAAIGLWVYATARLALALPAGPRRGFLAATSAAWLGYAVLSVSSPEILNFRVAPLLGLGLAMALGAAEPRAPAGGGAP